MNWDDLIEGLEMALSEAQDARADWEDEYEREMDRADGAGEEPAAFDEFAAVARWMMHLAWNLSNRAFEISEHAAREAWVERDARHGHPMVMR